MAPNLFPAASLPLYAAVETIILFRTTDRGDEGRFTFWRYLFGIWALNYMLYVVFWLSIYPRFFSPLRHFPQAKPLSIWELRHVFGGRRSQGERMVRDMKVPNDGLLKVGLIFLPNLLCTTPAVFADVLVHHPYDFVKSDAGRNFLRELLGDGLVVTEGDLHKFQRKNITPSFSFRHIKELYPMMWKKSFDLVDSILLELRSSGAEKDSGVVEITKWSSRATLDIMGIAGMGNDLGSLRNAEHPLAKNYENLLRPNPARLVQMMVSAMLGWRLGKMLPMKINREFAQQSGAVREICQNMVAEKREAVKRGGDHYDILGVLLKSNNFSDEELSDHLLTFMAAGHDTTSTALSWVTYVLSTRSQLQQQLRDELRQNLPSDYRAHPPSNIVEILDKLPLLNAICLETLRLYPPVPATMREAAKDTRILDHRIPKGTRVIFSMWAIQRNPNFWGPTAAEFDPQRWITDGKFNNHGGAVNNYCNMTFLHGPRSCIGMSFAKAELRCLVAAFVLSFEWTLGMPEEDVTPAESIVLKPRKGLKLQCKYIGDS